MHFIDFEKKKNNNNKHRLHFNDRQSINFFKIIINKILLKLFLGLPGERGPVGPPGNIGPRGCIIYLFIFF
mgnify:CR=1 FL=1